MILSRVLLQALNLISIRQLTTIQQILNQRQSILNLRVHQAPHATATLHQLSQRHNTLRVTRQTRALLTQEHQSLMQRNTLKIRLRSRLITRNEHNTRQLIAEVITINHVQTQIHRVLLILRRVRVNNHRQRLRIRRHNTLIRNNRSLIRQVRKLRTQETRRSRLTATRNTHQRHSTLRLRVTNNSRMQHHTAANQLLNHRQRNTARQILHTRIIISHTQRRNLIKRTHQRIRQIHHRLISRRMNQHHLIKTRQRSIRLIRSIKKLRSKRLPRLLKTLHKRVRHINQIQRNFRASNTQNNRLQIHQKSLESER